MLSVPTNALAWNAKASTLDKLVKQWQATCHKNTYETLKPTNSSKYAKVF
jgi:hypothetical protein